MQLPILIEPSEGGRFRARSGEPQPLAAEAATRDEAIGQLEKPMVDRLRNGTQVQSRPLDNEVPGEFDLIGQFFAHPVRGACFGLVVGVALGASVGWAVEESLPPEPRGPRPDSA
jgi:hypothetical protein